MMNEQPPPFEELRRNLYSAVVCDALDQVGLQHQSPRVLFGSSTWRAEPERAVLVGRCRTMLWIDMHHLDTKPYELELRSVDACRPGDLIVAATGGSFRSGIWGELLTTAAMQRGCVGAIIDGAVRDVDKIADMGFPVFARGTSPYDSLHRQRVIEIDVPVKIDGVTFHSGDLVFADRDGVVVVPQQMERQVLELALAKVHGENKVRDAIRGGMSATEAFNTYGVL
ncbi:MAG: RraA family protein [Planctomycetota bacterium]|jgi:4-hydroxy-4-methyl-2-oxoglutarate aldolase